MNKADIKQYIGTIIFSLFIVFILSLCVQIELLFRCEDQVNFEELNTKNLSEFITLEELEKHLKDDPSNHLTYIKLAQIYEGLGRFDKANEFYKTALSLSGRSDYSLYSYALFCAKNNLYVFAATLAEQLSGNNLKNNYYKAKIYENIALSLSKKGDYEASVKSYQIVYKYAKSIGKKSYINEIKEKYSYELIMLADYHVQKKEIEAAIADLNNSLKLKRSALALYKLGLVYIRLDNVKAEKLIHEAFELNPVIVNPYIYNSVLQGLIDESNILNKISLANFYQIRQKNFETKLNQVYLYKGDIKVLNTHFRLKNKTLFSKKKYYLVYKIQNSTDKNITKLNLKIDVYLNSKKYQLEKKLFSATSPLKAKSVSDVIIMDVTDEIEFSNLDQNNSATVRFFARKNENAPWILTKIDLIDI